MTIPKTEIAKQSAAAQSNQMSLEVRMGESDWQKDVFWLHSQDLSLNLWLGYMIGSCECEINLKKKILFNGEAHK